MLGPLLVYPLRASTGRLGELDCKLCRLRFRPQETIFHQGGPVASLYILCRGYAKLVFGSPSGKGLLIRFCRPGDLLEGVLSEEHVVFAVALDEAMVGLLPKELAVELLETQPKLALEVARRLAQDRHMLLGRLAYFAYGSVRARLLKGLLELGKHYGVRCEQGLLIDLPLSRQDLAELLGASRQTVCQELRKLAKRDLIHVAGRRITLTDPEALRRLV
ncbi:Crp/Fnr family transcriptional regulator [Candidatus Bipolaricaulota bacterium]|nr:Crp/Fnr family transcriptional regulator [Candidatus Bipolaricaulota bacterium]